MPPASSSRRSPKREVARSHVEMVQKVKEEDALDPKAAKIVEEERRIVKDALDENEDAIIKSIAEVKVQIGKSLDEIAEKRLTEHKKLVELEKSVALKTKDLQEVYEITRTAETFTALIRAQDEQKNAFENEMAETKRRFEEEMTEARRIWEKERAAIEEEIGDHKAQVERERKQDEEEYQYKVNKKRQAETDAYEQKKAALDKELANKRESFDKEFGAREAALKTQEAEIAELRKKAASFPSELDKSIKETEKSVRDRIETLYKHQAEMLQKEVEGERKLHAQAVQSLEAKIQEKDALIAQLTKKTDETGRQVQEIAVKAIDGASKLRVIREYPEKERGQEKG